MYLESLLRYGSRRATSGKPRLIHGSIQTQRLQSIARRSAYMSTGSSVNYDTHSVSPFILQSQKHALEYERIINLSTRLLNLSASELESERLCIEKEFAETSSCANCESFADRSIKNFRDRIISQVSTDNSTINEITQFVLKAQSKLFRPRLGLLVARMLSDYGARTRLPKHSAFVSDSDSSATVHSAYAMESVIDRVMRLLQSYEIVHAGSLIHDDIVDDAETRRSQQAVHLKMGTKLSVLVGDLMLTRACTTVANLGSQLSTVRMAKTLENLIKGELMVVKASQNVEDMLKVYLRKIFLKTASLIAECCASIADLFSYDSNICHKCYLIGLHVGMAFQICDDLLDYRGKSSQLGKPAMNDLGSGLITMPLIFALPESRELAAMLEDGHILSENVESILSHVRQSNSFERTQSAVLLHLYEISQLLRSLNTGNDSQSPLSESAQTLLRFVYDTVTRTKG